MFEVSATSSMIRTKTLSGRIFLYFFISIVIVSSGFFLFTGVLLLNAGRLSFDHELETELTLIKKMVEGETLEDPFLNKLKSMVDTIEAELDLADASGKVLFSTGSAPDSIAHLSEFNQALRGEAGTARRLSPATGQQIHSRLDSVYLYDGQKVFLRLKMGRHKHKADQRHIWLSALLFGILVIGGGILFAIIIARRFTWPLRLLTSASRRVAQGDFSVRVHLERDDEFVSLADNFNQMTVQLDDLFQSLTVEKEELESIISKIQEGILVVDHLGRTVRRNKSLETMFTGQFRTRERCFNSFENEAITTTVQKALKVREKMTLEIDHAEKILLCSISPLLTQNLLIIIFFDITELKNIEAFKREIVANVSHELRTPLTTITGFVDTLIDYETELDEPDENRLRFLSIVKRNCERLINLVKDLLQIAYLEKEQVDLLDIVDVPYDRFFRQLDNVFVEKFAKKNLRFRQVFGHKGVSFPADEFKIEQVFINLIDNAIKYTDQGEITLRTSNPDPDAVQFEVEDTGIGIPEKDYARIFERFYVVDKSRSKASGGTGLGLAIVKKVVELHGGQIRVGRGKSGGTCFTLTLPITKKRPGSD
jgi:two-component system phosphate regulon sensor histidine kinase PhoR